MLNDSRTAPSSVRCKKRFGSLGNLYQLVGYKRNDSVHLRKRSRRVMSDLHRQIVKRLTAFFPDMRVLQQSNTARPKTLHFSSGLVASLVVCLSERTCLGQLRWRFNAVSARRQGLPTLLCLCDARNKRGHVFYAMPAVSHIRVVSLLKADDARLAVGVRLKRLSDFRSVIHSSALFALHAEQHLEARRGA